MTISIQFESLTVAQGNVRTCLSDVSSSLTDLQGALKPTFEAWQGDSSDAAQALKLRWDQAATSMHDIGELIAKHLGVSYDGYTNTERANANRFA